MLLLVSLVATACGHDTLPARIAFSASREVIRPANHRRIYVMNDDGSNVMQLMSDSADNFCPAWSPDGLHIAFISEDGSYPNHIVNISMIDADGAKLVRLTSQPTQIFNLAWSPDGQHIAFSAVLGVPPSIFIMDADGSNVVRLTKDLGKGSGNDYRPAWSPDGRRIAFTSNRGYANGTNAGYDDYNIYVMDADRSNVVQLTRGPANDQSPAWSPDGRRIAFASSPCPITCDNGEGWRDFDIYVMDADGSNVIQLTRGPANDYSPAWSPDGRRIAFVSSSSPLTCIGKECQGFDIYVMNADGSNVIQLTSTGNNLCPAWQP